jgi:receptor protein-tyrosine kinase
MALFGKEPESRTLEPAPAEEAKGVPISREELVILARPSSPIAEQYRQLRNSIQALNPDGAPRTVVLTSAVAGEGKTVATLNLALALCELPRMRVLVLEADLHRPSVERYLSLPRRQGLCELLKGQLSYDQAVRATSVRGLSILSAGQAPEKSSELLGSERLRTVLHQLKQRFDYVLIDTPPAIAISDASMLGALSDGIVLVVRLGATPRYLVEQVYNLLESMGGNVLGTCLTASGEEQPSYA